MTVRVQSITKGELTRLLYTFEVKTFGQQPWEFEMAVRETPPDQSSRLSTHGQKYLHAFFSSFPFFQ